MNPKYEISIEDKRKAVGVGIVSVGERVDVSVSGLDALDVPVYDEGDVFSGPSLRFRIVDNAGRDLVRFPVDAEDEWEYSEGVFRATVSFDTDKVRRHFCGVAFNDSVELGVIIDSSLDEAEYGVGKIRLRQWSKASSEDPTVLPDWRQVLAKLKADLAAVESAKNDAIAAKDGAESARSAAEDASETAEEAKDAALTGASEAAAGATSAAESARVAANAAEEAKEAVDGVLRNSGKQKLSGSLLIGDNSGTAEGNLGELALAVGSSGVTASGKSSFAHGSGTVASGKHSHAEGLNTVASGDDAHAEGDTTEASGNLSHAEGNRSKAIGGGSHAEGYMTIARGELSHTEGGETYTKAENQDLSGKFAHAEGVHSGANGYASHAAGSYGCANHDYAWVWSGVTYPAGHSETEAEIAARTSHGKGTFTINPQGGTSGFFIGNTSLASLLNGIVGVVKKVCGKSPDANGNVALETSDISGLPTALAGKANATHTHAQSEVQNLSNDLHALDERIDDKADATHTHTIGNVTGLQDALAGKLGNSGNQTLDGSLTIGNLKIKGREVETLSSDNPQWLGGKWTSTDNELAEELNDAHLLPAWTEAVGGWTLADGLVRSNWALLDRVSLGGDVNLSVASNIEFYNIGTGETKTATLTRDILALRGETYSKGTDPDTGAPSDPALSQFFLGSNTVLVALINQVIESRPYLRKGEDGGIYVEIPDDPSNPVRFN